MQMRIGMAIVIVVVFIVVVLGTRPRTSTAGEPMSGVRELVFFESPDWTSGVEYVPAGDLPGRSMRLCSGESAWIRDGMRASAVSGLPPRAQPTRADVEPMRCLDDAAVLTSGCTQSDAEMLADAVTFVGPYEYRNEHTA